MRKALTLRNSVLGVTQGAFHSTKNSGLNFQKFPAVNETAFSEISRKEGDLARYIQIFDNFFPGNSVPLDVFSRNFRLNGLYFRNSTIFGFLKEHFHTVCPFSKFRNFWFNAL